MAANMRINAVLHLSALIWFNFKCINNSISTFKEIVAGDILIEEITKYSN
jgi:hypothetical protein